MGEPACDLLAAELALDRVEAELATVLPAHVRAFARAHAGGTPPPPAPRHGNALAAARDALAHPLLADRALAVLRLIVPPILDGDPAVTAARLAEPTWAALAALASARDAAARSRFGLGFLELMHRLHGSSTSPGEPAAPWPAPIAGWHDRDAPLAAEAVADAWRDLAARHAVRGSVRILTSAEQDIVAEATAHRRHLAARPRAFVVEPGREVIVVVPAVIDTPAARFAALHELGHALHALIAPPEPPRSLDEAVAAWIARSIEDPAHPWHSPLATAARHRRTALAVALDAVERALPALAEVPVERPPWALWHDAGAQAAYVTAERLADRWSAALGPHPAPGVLAATIADERLQIDRVTRL